MRTIDANMETAIWRYGIISPLLHQHPDQEGLRRAGDHQRCVGFDGAELGRVKF